MNRIPRFLGSLILVLIMSLLLGELGLRLLGLFQDHRLRSVTEISRGSFRIVFLGNSHTYGQGVRPEETYSKVLENFFRKEAPSAKVEVIQLGIVNGTTRKLLQRMKSFLPKTRPQLVVMMAGEANTWNRQGFSDYVAEARGHGAETFDLKEFLSHSYVLKWIYSLKEIPVTDVLTRTQKDDLIVYNFLGDWDQSSGIELIDERGTEVRDALLRFVSRHEASPPPEWRRALFILGLVEIRKEKKFASGLEKLGRALTDGPAGAYELIENVEELDEKKFPKESQGQLSVLKARARKLRDPLSEILARAADTHEFPVDQELMELVVRDFPYNSRLMFGVAANHFRLGNYARGVSTYARLLETNPLENQFNSIFEEIKRASTHSDDEVRRIANQSLEDLKRRFPTEPYDYARADFDELGAWIRWDLKGLVQLARKAGAKVVLQTYHFHGHRPQQKSDQLLARIIGRTASEEKTSFLETHPAFMREVSAFPGKASEFFVDDWLHPTPRGHRMIARIIYDHLEQKNLLPAELLHLDSKQLYRFSWE